MTNIGPSWTDERIEQLRWNAAAGLSASQIAARLGVTRNAVIGKLGRLGVLLEREPTGGRHLRRKGIAKSRPWRPKPKPEPEPEPEPISDQPPDQSDFACTIADLTDDKCRYPLSEPSNFYEFRYCGAPSRGPWCQRHRRILYKPAGARA